MENKAGKFFKAYGFVIREASEEDKEESSRNWQLLPLQQLP
jgi:hypothetical protein